MIEYLLFDLDNTLYPESSGFMTEVDRRMSLFVAEFVGVSPEEAKRLRRERGRAYGTTLEWLREEHGFTDAERYFETVHPEDVASWVPLDGKLAPLLRDLGIPMSVLTNSPMEHALRVLRHLGVHEMFEHVFDLRFNENLGKPAESTFRKVLERLGRRPERMLFIDDRSEYLEPFRRMGGRVLLIDEAGTRGERVGIPTIRSIHDLAGHLASLNGAGTSEAPGGA